MVIDTMFQVDEVNNPHIRNLLFHNWHSNVARIPSLCITRVSGTVNVTNSNTTAAVKSSKLYKNKMICPGMCMIKN